MLYSTKIQQNTPNSKKLKIELSSFADGPDGTSSENISQFSNCKFIQNYSYSDGALKSGLGLSTFESYLDSPELIQTQNANIKNLGPLKKVFLFKIINDSGVRNDKLLILDNSLNLFSAELYGSSALVTNLNKTFSSIPFAVNYNLNSSDVIILCSPTDSMWVWDGVLEPYVVANAPKMSSMTIHSERLFATSEGTEQNTVWFSDDLDPTNWSVSLDEAGFIKMQDERGKCNKVISFLDYCYVFRDFGISRITGYGDQSSFSVAHIYKSGEKIFPNSVVCCGEFIVFATHGGLFAFDGLNVVRIAKSAQKFFENSTISDFDLQGGYANNKYYLLNYFKFADFSPANKLMILEYDFATKKYSFSSTMAEFECLSSFETERKAFCVIALSRILDNDSDFHNIAYFDSSGAVQGQSKTGNWISPFTDFGYSDKKKNLQKISILTKGEITISVKTENGTKSFSLSGKAVSQTKVFRLSGFRFEISIVGNSENAEISNLHLEFSTF